MRGARDTAAFAAELEARLVRLFAAPYERSAAVLSGPEVDEARALRSHARRRSGSCARCSAASARDPSRVLRVLEQLEVNVGEPPQPDRVQVATPEAIRARRFEVVFACGLQEGEFPRGASPEPFLSDEDRRAIATRATRRSCSPCARTGSTASATSSTSAPRAPSACWCSARARATRRATRRRSRTSWTTCATCSARAPSCATRSLSDVTWTAEDAPTAAELDRAHAAAGPRRAGAARPGR